MKIELIYHDKYPIGWKMIPQDKEDDHTIAIVRDLQFFGFDSTNIEYAGLVLKDDAIGKQEGNVAELSWKQNMFNKE